MVNDNEVKKSRLTGELIHLIISVVAILSTAAFLITVTVTVGYNARRQQELDFQWAQECMETGGQPVGGYAEVCLL